MIRRARLVKVIDNIFTGYATHTSPTGKSTERDIILVGHDVGSDDRYLASIGCNLDTKNIVHRVDSKDLHQHLRSDDNGRGLSTVLADLGIDAFNLHNAGNDAVYTLQAAIACAIEGLNGVAKRDVTPVPGKKHFCDEYSD
jgi:hypothetical protein